MKKVVEVETKKAHDQYLMNLFDDENTEDHEGRGCKRLWSYIKALKRDIVGVSPLDHMGKLVTSGEHRAQALSDQYEGVFTMEDLTKIPYKGSSPFTSMKTIIVTIPGVEKLLNKLNPKKALGPDLLPTTIIKDNADILAPILTKIFQQSLDSGDVPTDWTLANVSAIFKKGNRCSPSNYRPVSLTCVICKVLEHIIFRNIMDHCDLNQILNDFQHGFRTRHSCESQLINTVEELARNLDHKKQTDCIILDFSKAFDTVPHQRLLYKLRYYGIKDNTLKWIDHWLTSRMQTVVVDGSKSKDVHVKSGVPQGTVLGPLLFLLYINDIADKTHSQIKLFADDCILFHVV